MAKIPPRHSDCVSDRTVYHDYDKCLEGKQIAIYNHKLAAGRIAMYRQLV